MEILLVLIGGGGLLGMPPGERDAAFLKGAPPQSLVYLEWASRGAGKPGAPGLDGFVADPEIQALFGALDKLLLPPDVHSNFVDPLRLAKLVTAHSGCLFVFADPPADGDESIKIPAPAEVLAKFHACVIVNAGADAEAILDAIRSISHLEIPKLPRMHEIPAPMRLRILIHQEGDRLLIGLGEGTIERALAGLRGETPGLDTNPRFQAGWKRVALDRVGAVGWLDVRGIAEVALQTMGPAGLLAQVIWRGAGADALDSVVSAAGVVEGNVIQRTFVTTGGRTDGVLLLAKSPGLRLEQLSHIPADSDLVFAASADFSQLVSGARDLLAKTNPLTVSVFDEAVKELETELGLSLDKQVYPAFGNAWTAFNSPAEGGLAGSGLIVAVEVRDRAKAEVVFNRLLQLLEQSLPMGGDSDFGVTAELKRQEFQGHSISYVSRSGFAFGGGPAAIPSFCLTRGHLLFAVHPQALKAHLRQSAKPRPGFETVARTKLALSGDEFLLAGYFDGVRVIHLAAAVLPYFGQMMKDTAEGGGSEFDPFLIPSSAALVPYSGDVAVSASKHKEGLLVESKNPHLGLALIALVGTASVGVRLDSEMLLNSKKPRPLPAGNAGLGAAEGQVVPAAAEQPAAARPADPQSKESTASAVARRLTPLVLKALVPDDIQTFIPDEVFRRLSEPPSPEVLKQREERRKQLEERRRQRLERRGITPRRSKPPSSE
jgi:hypothetical protein